MKIVINVHSLLHFVESKKQWFGVTSGKLLIKKLCQLDKNLDIFVFSNKLSDEALIYWLDTNKIRHNGVVDKIEETDIYIGGNCHNLKANYEDWLAYSITGKQNKEFVAGDIVELRSGGFPMTIKSVNLEAKIANCFYFNFDGDIMNCEFGFSSLKKTSENWHKMIDEDKKLEVESD